MPEERLGDEAEEARAQLLFTQLRCVSCDGQVIANSDAALSVTMRQMIREKITVGDSDAEIKQFFVLRYGTDILADGYNSYTQWLLYLLPIMIVLVASRFYFKRSDI